MKKELKRYLLVEDVGIVRRICRNINEYKELLHKIDLYNKNQKNDYIFGNVSYFYDSGFFYVNICKYKKLTDKMGISDIDELTYKMDEEALKCYFSDKIERSNPCIFVGYFNEKPSKEKTYYDVDKRISMIPVLYRKSTHILSKSYVMQMIKCYIHEGRYEILYDLCNEFDSYKIIAEDIEKLRYELNKSEKNNDRLFAIVYNLYDNLVNERDKNGSFIRNSKNEIQKSRRRVRDFGFFVESHINKKEEVLEDIECNDRLQEEYALFKWDQDTGIFRKNFVVGYDEQNLKFVKRY